MRKTILAGLLATLSLGFSASANAEPQPVNNRSDADAPTSPAPASKISLGSPLTPIVPEKLKVPEGNKVIMQTLARGVQIYTCKANEKNELTWTLKVPSADLLDDQGKRLGTHYGGPTWEASDGSMVSGKVLERVASADPNAIPLVLLQAKETKGNGVFSRVSYIQRLQTSGGNPPRQACDRAQAGSETMSNYFATYVFYGR
jgi:hypothetical protein